MLRCGLPYTSPVGREGAREASVMPHENMNRKHEDPPEEPLDVPGVLRPEACPAVDDEAGACSGAVSLTSGPGGSKVLGKRVSYRT